MINIVVNVVKKKASGQNHNLLPKDIWNIILCGFVGLSKHNKINPENFVYLKMITNVFVV